MNWCGSFSIRRRLLNVAGSLSSALTHMSVSFRSFGRKLHFSPHGKPAPPRPRSSESLTIVTTESGSRRQRLPRGLVAAPRLVDLERVAVGHVPVAAQDGFKRGHGRVVSSRFERVAGSRRSGRGSRTTPSSSAASRFKLVRAWHRPIPSSSGPKTRPSSARAAGAKSQMPRHSANSTVSLPSGGRLAGLDPQPLAGVLEHLVAAAEHARERPADPDPHVADRRLREEAVEAHRVVDLGRRDLEQLGDLGHRLVRARSASAPAPGARPAA